MMNNQLQNILKNLPQKPGIYQFFNNMGRLLYVGKAKNLRSRVRSYFNEGAELSPAKRRMVSLIDKLEVTLTDNEQEALLLETNLIKEYKPPYNVVLKDDKYWQYIKIDYDGYWPQIYSVRRPDFRQKTKSIYFGPYTSGLAVRESLRLINKLFPVCLKTPAKKTSQPQPCFNFQLGRCLGPCVGQTTPEEYSKVFEDIRKFLKGSRLQLTKKLTERMSTYSSTQHYEAAGRIRNQIKALKKLENRQKVVTQNQADLDILSLYREGSRVAVNLFKVRQGKLLDKFNTAIKSPAAPDAEIIESFIAQYYTSTTDLPGTIITQQPINYDKILDIPLRVTRGGKKLQLLKLGLANAKEFLKQQESFFDRSTRLAASRQAALVELRDILKLKTLPARIETYDVSNIQGRLAVGSMVVFINGEAKKSEYRRFNIRLKQTPDDVHMLAEVLRRRLQYLTLKKDSRFAETPDLLVIDGGQSQLNAALQVRREFKLNLPVISLAKRLEEIYLPGQKEPLRLPRQSAALLLLQRSRDEAHRFAITAYRQRHGLQTLSSILDEFPGIGPKTKNILVKKFQTLSKIKKTSREELAKVIGKQKAKIIKDNL